MTVWTASLILRPRMKCLLSPYPPHILIPCARTREEKGIYLPEREAMVIELSVFDGMIRILNGYRKPHRVGGILAS